MLGIGSKIDHRFTMPMDLAQAQSVFVEQVASELARQYELKIWREEPGLLVLNDDIWHPEGWQFTGGSGRGAGRTQPKRSGKTLRIEFTADDHGTAVRIQGRCERAVREQLETLGRPRP
jgi:hypothetical protein